MTTATIVQGAYSGEAGQPGDNVNLNNSNETPVLHLNWIGGNVLVQGRVRISNSDGDMQWFSVWLTHGYPTNTIDYYTYYLQPDCWAYVFLIGWAFNLAPNEIIEIRCATYKGEASVARMVATLMDDPR